MACDVEEAWSEGAPPATVVAGFPAVVCVAGEAVLWVAAGGGGAILNSIC